MEEKTHRVQIGRVVRHLPVERPPGKPFQVAVFDMLGDHEVAKAAGTELVRRIPSGVQVLIMPNGNPDDAIAAAAPTTTTAPAPPAGATLGGEIVEKIESAIDRATSDSGGSGGGGNVA